MAFSDKISSTHADFCVEYYKKFRFDVIDTIKYLSEMGCYYSKFRDDFYYTISPTSLQFPSGLPNGIEDNSNRNNYIEFASYLSSKELIGLNINKWYFTITPMERH